MLKARLIIILVTIVILALYVWFILQPVLNGYIYFTEFAAELINKKQRANAIRHTITPERFLIIQKIVIAVGVLLCILFAFSISYVKAMAVFFQRITSRLKLSWASNLSLLRETSLSAKIVFTSAIIYLLVQSIWYITHLPFIHDEAYTISNFILPGPLASITFYPYPNNHIFFSLSMREDEKQLREQRVKM